MGTKVWGRLWGASVAVLCAAMAVGGAQAQTAGDDGEAEEAVAGTVYLDPITVYATLSPLAAFDYPGQVAVVEREEIETLQPSAIGDVFQGVPGVFVDGGVRRGGQAPTIRGSRTEDILILLDGTRQNFLSGHEGRLFIEPDLLKSVEVVKGPVSALYGSGALGGVIALTTVDAADFLEDGETAGVRFKAGYQSVFDEFMFTSTGFARSDDGRFDVIGSFTYRNSGDIELGNGNTLDAADDIKSGLVKGSAELSPDLKLTTSWIHYQDDAREPSNPQANNVPDTSNALVDRFTESDTVIGKLSYAPADSRLIDGNLTAYWSLNSVDKEEVLSGRETDREVETLGINVDNRSRFDLSDWSKLTLTYGAEYSQDEQTGSDSGSADGSRGGVPNASATFGGVFTQAELTMEGDLGMLTVTPGVRWDRFTNDTDGQDEFSDTAVSPRVGTTYKPVPWLLLFGSYGEAFRAPTFNELYADGLHFPGFINNNFIPNPDLKPQDGSSVEVGAGLDFKDVAVTGDRLTVKGSYWAQDVDNFINTLVVADGCFPPVIDPANCYSQYVNAAHAELDGVEIELNYDSGRFYGTAAYSTIDGKDTTTGEYLGVLYPDKLFFDLGIKVTELWSRFGTRLTFADEFDKGEHRDAYQLVDIYAVIEPEEGPFKGFRLDLGIDNVTDEAYELVAAGAFEEGRNYKAAITWTHKW